MPTQPPLKLQTDTLSFDKFWSWLQGHRNCILSAGTTQSVLYDSEDFHWHFGSEDGTLLVQVLRGKELVGEILLEPQMISYVQSIRHSEDEYEFDCVSELESEPMVICYFTMSHEYDAQEGQPKKGRLMH